MSKYEIRSTDLWCDPHKSIGVLWSVGGHVVSVGVRVEKFQEAKHIRINELYVSSPTAVGVSISNDGSSRATWYIVAVTDTSEGAVSASEPEVFEDPR